MNRTFLIHLMLLIFISQIWSIKSANSKSRIFTFEGIKAYLANYPENRSSQYIQGDLDELTGYIEQNKNNLSPPELQYLIDSKNKLKKSFLMRETFEKCSIQSPQVIQNLSQKEIMNTTTLCNSTLKSPFSELQNYFSATLANQNSTQTQTRFQKQIPLDRFTEQIKSDLQNTITKISALSASQLAKNLNRQMSVLKSETERLKVELKRISPDAVDYKQWLYAELSAYESKLHDLFSMDGSQLLLQPPLSDFVFLPIKEDITDIGIVEDIKIPRQITTHLIEAAKSNALELLKEKIDSLKKNSSTSNLGLLFLQHPQSVIKTLVTLDDNTFVSYLKNICEQVNTEMASLTRKKEIISNIETGLSLTSLAGGLGGIGIGFVAKKAATKVLARVLLAGSSISGATDSALNFIDGKYSYSIAKDIETLWSQFPESTQSPELQKSYQNSKNQIENTFKDAVISGSLSPIGAAGALKLFKLEVKGFSLADLTSKFKDFISKTSESDKKVYELIGRATAPCL
jgi:hypothetical protein